MREHGVGTGEDLVRADDVERLYTVEDHYRYEPFHTGAGACALTETGALDTGSLARHGLHVARCWRRRQ